MSKRHSFSKDKIKIVLFEKVHEAATEVFEESGFQIARVSGAATGAELQRVLEDAHIIGVRSRSEVTAEALQAARRLLAIGCFTVGTDQVDLDAATTAGVPVFNAPHSSTRSVAELAIGCSIALARRLCEKSAQMHAGRWNKSAQGCTEIRNKTLGVIGYGHIGQQVGLLAEAVGMNVLFFDTVKKLPLGRARSAGSLDALLPQCDFISLHVPANDSTKDLFGAHEVARCKRGAFILNLSRGAVVDLQAVMEGLRTGHIGGGAFDVFPVEPPENDAPFVTELAEFPTVILTPHIGGSTEEAQRNIGREVATSLIQYIDNGSTMGAVNFPQIALPQLVHSHRILNVHRNLPGALTEINAVVASLGANIDAQYLSTFRDVGYLIMDINKELSEEMRDKIAMLPKSIKTRILF